MKKGNIFLIAICAVIILGTLVYGKAANKDDDPKTDVDNSVEDNSKGSMPHKDLRQFGEYETVGEIIAFDKKGVHILTGDIAEIYNVDQELLKDFYLGETVGVVKDNNNAYVLEKYENENFDVRHTNMGELIVKTTGEVKNISKEKLIITTEEGDIEFTLYEEVFLEKGAKVMVEYLERLEGNMLIAFYAENAKLDLTVKNISRADNTGIMVLDTEDSEGMKYVVYVLGETVLNFNHSDLNVEDEIAVYYDVIRESYPAQVDAKLIIK